MIRNRIPSVKRAALTAAATVTAIGSFVGIQAASVSAATLPLVTVSCTGPYVYGSSISCTISVTSLNILSTTKPTGTVSLGTLLGRLSATSCTLSPTATTRKSACTVAPTALDTGVMAPGATYGGDSNFTASVGVLTSPVLGFNVTSAPLTITANNASRDYGTANPSFSVSYGTFQNGDDEGDLLGTLSCNTTADANSPVNTYPITCSGLSSKISTIYPLSSTPHYSITYVDGTLTVGKVALDITADDKSRIVGTANPAFTVKYSTFSAGDDETDLGGTLSCNTTADTNSAIGDYPITCSGLTSDNYAINFVAGTLHVLNAPNGNLPGGGGSYPAGGTVDVDVHDFKPGSIALVNGCGIVDGQILIDENGDGHATFNIPAGMDSTTCELTVTGTDNVDAPADVVLSMAVLGLCRPVAAACR